LQLQLPQNPSTALVTSPVPQSPQSFDPRDPRVWCPYIEPAKVMRLLEKMGGTQQPVNTSCRVCIEISAFVLNGIIGAEAAETVLCACFAKPILAPHAYKQRMGSSTRPFNAAIIGPPGSGKRTAVKRACSLCGATLLCVGPDTYEPWALTVATSYATRWRPTLIYFDGFDEMCAKEPEFLREFNAVVIQNRELIGSWNYSWIVLGISNRETALPCVEEALATLCIADNIAEMRKATGEELATLAMEFLAEYKIPILPKITSQQLDQLRIAVSGATPADVHEFIMRVAASAMKNADLRTLESDDSGFGGAIIVGGGGGGSKSKAPGCDRDSSESSRCRTTTMQQQCAPSLGDLSSVVDSGGRVFDPGATRSDQVMREGNGTPTTIHVDWIRDAVSKYVSIEAVDCEDGYSKFVIPRKNGPGMFK
jgi:hypothetical protein